HWRPRLRSSFHRVRNTDYGIHCRHRYLPCSPCNSRTQPKCQRILRLFHLHRYVEYLRCREHVFRHSELVRSNRDDVSPRADHCDAHRFGRCELPFQLLAKVDRHADGRHRAPARRSPSSSRWATWWTCSLLSLRSFTVCGAGSYSGHSSPVSTPGLKAGPEDSSSFPPTATPHHLKPVATCLPVALSWQS